MTTTTEQRDKWELCGAKKRNGEHCRNYAGAGTEHVGSGRCRYHLGKSPNHNKHAIKIVAERQRKHFETRMLEFGQVLKMDPLDALLMSVYLSASHEAFLRQEIARADDRDERMRRDVLMTHWGIERDRLARTSRMALDAGVDQRQIALAERYGEAIARLIQGILGELVLSKRQQAEAPAIVRKHLIAVSGEPVALPAAPR